MTESRQPSVYDHYRYEDDTHGDRKVPVGEYENGVYRVVGSEGGVTLLRVTDGSGNRANTGEVIHVPHGKMKFFEKTENPDPDFSWGGFAAEIPEITYWVIRAFLDQLSNRPLLSAFFTFVLIAGLYLNAPPGIPKPAMTGLWIAGLGGLLLIGSGRL
ncbi:MAG: hypothetical protein ABEK59_12790 [Halobacteria archaeon]